VAKLLSVSVRGLMFTPRRILMAQSPRVTYRRTEIRYVPNITATREIIPMRGGLIGHRTRGPSSTITPHIARADSLEQSPLWSEPFHKRRCIIPANVYFEWVQLKVFPTASPSRIPKCWLLLVYGTLGKTLPTASGLRPEFPLLTSRAAAVKPPIRPLATCELERQPQRELPDTRSWPAKTAGCSYLAERWT